MTVALALAAAAAAPAGAQISVGIAEPETYTTTYNVTCGNPCFSAPAVMEASQRAELVARVHNADTKVIPSELLRVFRGVPPFSPAGLPTDSSSASPFTDAESWSGNVVARGFSQLPPQQTAELTFSVRAPDVQSEQVFQEGFYLGSYRQGSTWILEPKTWNAVWDVRVFPKAPPVVNVLEPPKTAAGSPLRVAADVTDVGGVERVEFTLDGSEYGDADTTAPYEATFDTGSLEPGDHTLVVKAVDVLGLETTATRTLRIDRAGGGSDPGAPKRRLRSDVVAHADDLGSRGVRIRFFEVSAPAGSRISTSCVPRRCLPVIVSRTRKRTTRVGFRTRQALPIGTRIAVRVTKPGMIGEQTQFRVVRNNLKKSPPSAIR